MVKKMLRKKENEEGRMSIEFLRLLSYFVDYQSSSTMTYILVFLGLMISVLASVFWLIDLVDLVLYVGLYSAGAIIFFIAYTYLRKTRRQFRRYLDEVSQATLMRDSEYEDLVKSLNVRVTLESEKVLKETEKAISSLQKEADRLEKQIEEQQKKRKARD